MWQYQHDKITARREAAWEKGRNEAECIIAAEIMRQTGISRSDALREAARLMRLPHAESRSMEDLLRNRLA